MSAADVIWHDLECGSYREDLPLWQALAERYGGPVLDLGAGTGRVALPLARAGYAVTALDRDRELLTALAERAAGLPVHPVQADARAFELEERFALCLVPMQTIQLLPGGEDRLRCLRCIAQHLRPRGHVAIAISARLEPFDPGPGIRLPLPDQRELDGIVYSSQPTAIRRRNGTFVLERRREIVERDGGRSVAEDAVALAALSASQLEREARHVGLWPQERREIADTDDYAGSTVVILRG